MQEYYDIKIAGLDRRLPLCKIDDSLSIAAFIIFGDVEITIAAAKELLKKCPEFDYILTPEAKSIPLAYEMARQSNKKYFVARKGEKLYMRNAVSQDVTSITTSKEQRLFLDGFEGEKMRGKRILIIDDVISTGNSLETTKKLAESFDANVVAMAAILAEGDASLRDDIIFLEPLPLFYNQVK